MNLEDLQQVQNYCKYNTFLFFNSLWGDTPGQGELYIYVQFVAAHHVGFRRPSPDRRFLINFQLEINDFRAWRLQGQIPGFRRPSPDRRFHINFLLEIDDFRAWRLHS